MKEIFSTVALYNNALNEPDINLAIAKLTTIISMNYNDSKAFESRGLLYLKVLEYKKAIYDFSRAISLEPSPLLYEYRGIAYLNNKQYQSSIVDLNKAITEGGCFYHLYLNRGIAKYKLMDINDALKDITKSIQLSPDHPQGYAIRANIYQSLKLYRLAIKDIEFAIDVEPINSIYRETYNRIMNIDRSSMSLLDRIVFALKKQS